MPCWLLSLAEREAPQYTSNFYCGTPPICTAVRLPFVPAILLRKYQWLGGSGKLLNLDVRERNWQRFLVTIQQNFENILEFPLADSMCHTSDVLQLTMLVDGSRRVCNAFDDLISAKYIPEEVKGR